MNNTESEKKPQPSRGHKTICIPFTSEAQYQECLAEVTVYRTYLSEVSAQHPNYSPRTGATGIAFMIATGCGNKT